MSTITTELPATWRKARLLDIAELNPRRFTEPTADNSLVSFVPMKAVEEESGRLAASETRPWLDVKKGYTPFQDGDVIFAKITPCMENGKYAVARGLHGGRAAGSTEFHVFRSSAELDPQFLLFFLFSPEVRKAARMNMRGAAGQLRVPPIFFEGLELPLPPLDEQRRIVAEIEQHFTRLEAGVAALKRAQANLKRYRAAILKAACEGRLVPDEAKWPRRKLGDVTTKIGSGSTPRGGDAVYRDSGTPLIRSLNVHSTGFRFDGLAYIDEAQAKKLDHVVVTPADVLLNITGASIGRVTIAPESLTGARVNQHVCIIRPIKELLPKFLAIFLASPTEQARVVNVQVGATRQALTKAMVTNWGVPVPPLDEQERIVAEVERRLSVVEELETVVSINLQRATRLRQSILQKAFIGNLC